ncbi:MAG: DUF692 domain-containing protein [Sedimenticola sp.]|nr:DUF692 domain-containing protein [Sedimenticola sp.]MCW8946261.1 DUF692 domain-containing protein [Sedimenticola sp.]MCW8950150.1 DUF692 domain-containing protein [Sedimenticola sp.]MCW8974819.1 DUF692 domain-containing protein [Sedimenticola sp.]MCW9021640.1 DUF692 domain-containing protein [Sedimenticola sp.]
MDEAITSLRSAPALVPSRAGAGLKAVHYQTIIDNQPDIGWFEVHPENYMGRGGAPLRYLERIRADYPISLHSVGTSLGSHQPLDQNHLRNLKKLVDRFQPGLVSEHLSWSHGYEWFTHDLIPLIYNQEALDLVVSHIQQVQDYLQRQILIENPSSYLQFKQSDIPEQEFLVEAAKRSGAGLLLDVNNVYVSCRNHNWDIEEYLAPIPAELIGEIHLAGHAVQALGDQELLIDDHGSPICTAVWELYRNCIDRIGSVPTLIERDSNIPGFDTLYKEVQFAEHYLQSSREACRVSTR